MGGAPSPQARIYPVLLPKTLSGVCAPIMFPIIEDSCSGDSVAAVMRAFLFLQTRTGRDGGGGEAPRGNASTEAGVSVGGNPSAAHTLPLQKTEEV